ncbi:NAD(P)H-hydrate dehydratase [Nocardioides conyzicola]|uniref:ADP-dependent (S)-NAD(P)H-hydrate dehydratase n=1 Tax=Nocardioides conyzicola TaxID=1651781 RepID=A0ABP8Y1G2_9ACTN
MSTPDPVVVTPATLRDWALPEPGTGKESRGQVLVVGGSTQTPGAVRLAGEASLRGGAGKLALATVSPTAAALAVAVPESQVLALATDADSIAVGAADDIVDRAQAADVALVGPGFVEPAASTSLLERVLPRLTCPVVVDALGSAYLTQHPEGLHHLEGRAVLNVNPSELAHTAGSDEDEVLRDPLAAARAVAERSRVVVLCGGSSKYVVAPSGRAWVVEGGGPGLGVSGSGDVQAGIVTGLLARCADPAQAAVWGAYVHARIGERLAAAVGTVGYLARDMPEQVPAVVAEVG